MMLSALGIPSLVIQIWVSPDPVQPNHLHEAVEVGGLEEEEVPVGGLGEEEVGGLGEEELMNV